MSQLFGQSVQFFFFNSSKHAAHRNCLSHITRRHNPKRKSIIYVKKLRQQMSPAKGSRTSQRSFLLVSWHAWSKIARVSSGSANGWTSGTRKLPSALQGSVPRERHYLWFNIKKIEHKNVMHGFPSSGSLRCLSWQLVTNCQPTQRPKFQISPQKVITFAKNMRDYLWEMPQNTSPSGLLSSHITITFTEE